MAFRIPFGGKHENLKLKLIAERPAMATLDRHFAETAALRRDRSDWVSVYYDPENVHRSNADGIAAVRAITLQGRLIWLVRHPRKKRSYHAAAARPEDAVREAAEAWRRRAEMRAHAAEVQRIVSDLRFLRVRHDVTVDDAYASALCNEGVDGFLRALGLGRFRRFPGWLIAWLYALDRQVGYVLLEAHRRHRGETGGAAAAPASGLQNALPRTPARLLDFDCGPMSERNGS